MIFVDELDRCTPDTVLDIFAAMRLFLFVEKTSFIIGADSRLIDYAINLVIRIYQVTTLTSVRSTWRNWYNIP